MNMSHRSVCPPRRRGLVGIENAGNTCYASAVLQCLGHSPRMVTAILRPFPPGPEPSDEGQDRERVLRALRTLLADKWAAGAGGGAASPVELLRELSQWTGASMDHREQNDAHEFLIELMTALEAPPGVNLPHGSARENESLTHWQGHVAPMRCPPTALMYGQHAWSMTCGGCGRVTRSFDIFAALPLLLPEDAGPAAISRSETFASSAEDVDGFECDGCRRKTLARRCSSLSRLPPVLVVHVMRFRPGSSDKSMTPVELEERLDFCGGRTYQLRGMVCHRGYSLHGGHYYAVCRYASGWVVFDDDCVYEEGCALDAIRPEDPYLLFYEADSC